MASKLAPNYPTRIFHIPAYIRRFNYFHIVDAIDAISQTPTRISRTSFLTLHTGLGGTWPYPCNIPKPHVHIQSNQPRMFPTGPPSIDIMTSTSQLQHDYSLLLHYASSMQTTTTHISLNTLLAINIRLSHPLNINPIHRPHFPTSNSTLPSSLVSPPVPRPSDMYGWNIGNCVPFPSPYPPAPHPPYPSKHHPGPAWTRLALASGSLLCNSILPNASASGILTSTDHRT
jgi:hypothetical protein